MKNNNLMKCCLMVSQLFVADMAYSDEDNETTHEVKKELVKLTAEQVRSAAIQVKAIQLETVKSVINAPSEIKFNLYKTSLVSPRIEAQVIACHVELGELVNPGKAIITLASVEMAKAQSELLLADREWQRVKKLGRSVVSDVRYTEAKVNWQLSKARVLAYGMNEAQIKKLISSDDFTQASGYFQLVAAQKGVVLQENYITGQQVSSGHELLRITDESNLWVEAYVSPADIHLLNVGNKAKVHLNGQSYAATVSQIYHSLNEITKTITVRLLINNTEHKLQPGEYVNTKIETSLNEVALTLPEEALIRTADGEWVVMIEASKGEFISKTVELIRITQGRALIKGIDVGTQVVVSGSFIVWSELNKSSFGDDD